MVWVTQPANAQIAETGLSILTWISVVLHIAGLPGSA